MNLLPATTRAETPLAYLVERVRARGAVRDGEERPAAILWTDPGGDWSGILNLLRDRLPELLVLGDEYEPQSRTGPAIWLRCVVDGALDDAPDLVHRIPILYLPGVARQDLRAGDDCPDRVKPLVELLHRGVAWHHQNGRDWTASALLGSPEGMGLELANDRQTAASLHAALGEVALTKLPLLRGRRLEADDFDRLMVDDLPQNLLRWLGGPREHPAPPPGPGGPVAAPGPEAGGTRSATGAATNWSSTPRAARTSPPASALPGARGPGRPSGRGTPTPRSGFRESRICSGAVSREANS